MLDYLLNAFSGSGYAFMWAITAVMAFALAVLIEKSFLFLVKWKTPSQEILSLIQSKDFAQASALAGPIAGPVLENGQQEDSPEMAWEAMGAAAIQAEAQVRKRIPLLATAGNVATMLGLLGTVYGLTVAFSSLGEAGQSATDQLSQGISMAMATTAFGLCVAIPCVAAHAWLEARADTLLLQTESLAAELHLAKKRLLRSNNEAAQQ